MMEYKLHSPFYAYHQASRLLVQTPLILKIAVLAAMNVQGDFRVQISTLKNT